jgi:hypothetical protein
MLVYNHAEYLAKAIESVVRQQADEPFELLIGEDRSTDAFPRDCRGLSAQASGQESGSSRQIATWAITETACACRRGSR